MNYRGPYLSDSGERFMIYDIFFQLRSIYYHLVGVVRTSNEIYAFLEYLIFVAGKCIPEMRLFLTLKVAWVAFHPIYLQST